MKPAPVGAVKVQGWKSDLLTSGEEGVHAEQVTSPSQLKANMKSLGNK